MKRFVTILAPFLILGPVALPPAPSSAQSAPAKGNLELSTAASFTANRRGDDTDTDLILPIRVGSFLTDRLEFEVEGLLTTPGFGDAALLLSGLFSWHFPSSGRVHPFSHFLLLGAGVTNTVPVSTNFTAGGGDDYAAVLNLGGGIKTFVAEPVAVRLEYRYQRYAFDRYPQSNHMVLVGLSYFAR